MATRVSGTAEALVETGRRLFARSGYDGASVRAITQEAGANLGAVTYHFGSKRALYDAVVGRAVEPLAERVEAAAVSSPDPLESATAVVAAYFSHLRENPDLPFLMMQELAAGRDPPEPAAQAMRRIVGVLTELVRRGQARGSIRRGDPVLLALSVISQPLHLTVARRVVRVVAGIDWEDHASFERLVAHASSFVRAGLAAESGR